mmetsp:Transcript_23006/g.52677  ORF Transcript_23006/g.52677 Transcript_23006/m.52677 type:complete len:103 (-) Transcript_23006:177-485(-)
MPGAAVPVKVLEACGESGGPNYWGLSGSLLPSKTISVDVSSAMSVGDVKAQIESKEGIAQGAQRLLLFGCELQDDRSLRSYGVNDAGEAAGVTVALHLAPRT